MKERERRFKKEEVGENNRVTEGARGGDFLHKER